MAAAVAIGLAAVAGGGGGEEPLEVAGNEVPPPVEVDGKGALPVDGVPVAVASGAGGEEEKKKDKGQEKKGEKWLGHYSSAQDILLIGDGDFSFSLALATAFGSGANLVATSLDTYGSSTSVASASSQATHKAVPPCFRRRTDIWVNGDDAFC
ncbi:unnamed protein product [Urochloa humidicola]